MLKTRTVQKFESVPLFLLVLGHGGTRCHHCPAPLTRDLRSSVYVINGSLIHRGDTLGSQQRSPRGWFAAACRPAQGSRHEEVMGANGTEVFPDLGGAPPPRSHCPATDLSGLLPMRSLRWQKRLPEFRIKQVLGSNSPATV